MILPSTSGSRSLARGAAGTLTEDWAKRLGLRPGTAVAAGIINAHAGLPGSGVAEAARARGMDTHTYLCAEAEDLPPGSGGLLALGWWNGQRSPFVDDRLSGMMLGMTIRTTPAQQYRALMESTAYGTRLILDTFEGGGVPVREVVACGGIPRKNPLMLQIYADILNRPVQVTGEAETTALGAAIMAASAANLYSTPADAVRAMTGAIETVYRPALERAAAYDRLYREYRTLAEYFARENLVMHRMKKT